MAKELRRGNRWGLRLQLLTLLITNTFIKAFVFRVRSNKSGRKIERIGFCQG